MVEGCVVEGCVVGDPVASEMVDSGAAEAAAGLCAASAWPSGSVTAPRSGSGAAGPNPRTRPPAGARSSAGDATR